MSVTKHLKTYEPPPQLKEGHHSYYQLQDASNGNLRRRLFALDMALKGTEIVCTPYWKKEGGIEPMVSGANGLSNRYRYSYSFTVRCWDFDEFVVTAGILDCSLLCNVHQLCICLLYTLTWSVMRIHECLDILGRLFVLFDDGQWTEFNRHAISFRLSYKQWNLLQVIRSIG